MFDLTNGRSVAAQMRPRCSCGRFIGAEHGWFKYGEHGSEEGWVCARCLPTWTPRDSRGRGPEAGYCGIVRPAPGDRGKRSTDSEVPNG
jgi:hypothetical protein